MRSAVEHVVERRQLGILEGDVHEGVLVHLHGSTSLANGTTKLLNLLNGQAAVIDDPDSAGVAELLFDNGESLLIFDVGHEYTSFF